MWKKIIFIHFLFDLKKFFYFFRALIYINALKQDGNKFIILMWLLVFFKRKVFAQWILFT